MKLSEKGKKAKDASDQNALKRHKGKNDGSSNMKVALVDLFAGLRTVHVASRGTGMEIVLCHTAEKCNFANSLAKKNKIRE